MNSLFEKQVYVRLSEDGASFFYTVKYGRFATATQEMRLAGKAEIPGGVELVRGEIPRLAPVGVRVSARRQGHG